MDDQARATGVNSRAQSSQPPVSTTRRALTGAGAVTAGSLIANIAAYLLHLPASRWLGPEGYGAFAALLSAQLLVAVPSLALQAVVARERVRGASPDSLRSLGQRVALLVAVVAALAVVPVSLLLDTPVLATAAALAPGAVLCLLAAEQGLLQGAERFRALAVVLALAGCGKVIPAVAVLASGGGVGLALAAGAVGVAVAWVGALFLTTTRHAPSPAPSGQDPSLHAQLHPSPEVSPSVEVGLPAEVGLPVEVGSAPEVSSSPGIGSSPGGSSSPGIGSSPRVAAVIAAGQVQLVMMALTSVDLILARALLSPEDAGRYALGAVAAKAAFWLPQAVGTVLYPRMSDPTGHRGAVRSAVMVLAAIGAIVVVAAAVAAPLVPAVVGEAYRPVAGTLWAFAALGVVLSVLQAFLLATIALDRTVEAGIAWAGLALTVLAVWSVPREVGAVLGATLAVATLTTLVAGWRAMRSRSEVHTEI